ncbi:putative secreted protein [Wickerhamomyces ciferrii]|uniref:Secreted protein n=1 Tax=Wickerhamomyces ciferrii (strain ATCC 14091 / BCRC 22168 / CBS 111 / JCM 3599 / NBRC 0793 / NRRL Y-1031 F-60-10) TaxID=1206466 RepID=K0KU23_WICCF|nr:uncharacterized protein BN7_5109 [Wickerhamomyces ciferrii]CCH45527.1 putative secreted protein [Wickerhamomyces ciferrii]
MLLNTALTSLALASMVYAADDNTDDYKVVGSLIFGRHNDRPAKPANYLTPIGAEHQFQIGQFYRERYFGLDSSNSKIDDDSNVIQSLNKDGFFINGQIFAEASSGNVILFSHYAFLQGLYPPQDVSGTSTANQTLAALSNGTIVENPLSGYQYVKSTIQENATEEYIWTKGDENCPAVTKSLKDVKSSDLFQKYTNESNDFFQSLKDIEFINETFNQSELNFKNAMNIFDEVWVNTIHNETVSKQFNESLIDSIQFWSDRYQWVLSDNNLNSNLTIGAKTLMGRVMSKLDTTRKQGKPYLNYLTGSFNTMYQLASVINLDIADSKFKTMPDYGATYVFELLNNTQNDETFVRFSFKNGTQELNTYPIFNSTNNMMKWDDFTSNVGKIAIKDVSSWCNVCGYNDISSDNVMEMCVPYTNLYEQATKLNDEGVDLNSYKKNKLSLADAGGIGAGVTIGVFALIGVLGFLLYKLRGGKSTQSSNIQPTHTNSANSGTVAGSDSDLEKGSNVSTN